LTLAHCCQLAIIGLGQLEGIGKIVMMDGIQQWIHLLNAGNVGIDKVSA